MQMRQDAEQVAAEEEPGMEEEEEAAATVCKDQAAFGTSRAAR